MTTLHPTLQKIVQGLNLKTKEKLALDDPHWEQSWAELTEEQRPQIARQWLRQLHARSQHSRDMFDDLSYAIPKHVNWISTIHPYIQAEWFTNQNLGGDEGKLVKTLGLVNDQYQELLMLAWRGSAAERAERLKSVETNVSAAVARANYLAMGQYPLILQRLWAGAKETGVTLDHKLAMARLTSTLGFTRGFKLSLDEPFISWLALGKCLATERPYFSKEDYLQCKTTLLALPEEEVLQPLGTLLVRARGYQKNNGNALTVSGVLPLGVEATPYAVLRDWYPQYTKVLDSYESLGVDVHAAINAMNAKKYELPQMTLPEADL